MRQNMLTPLLIVLIAGLMGCVTKNEEQILGECRTFDLSFAQDIEPIIDQNCAISGCHDAATSTAGVNLEGYTNIDTHLDRVVARANDGARPMPPTGLIPECDRSKIDAWVAKGALNN